MLRRLVIHSLRITILITCGGVLFAIAWVTVPVLFDPSDDFIARKGVLHKIETQQQWQDDHSHYQHLRLWSSSGLYVELTLRTPHALQRNRPLVMLLGGHRTGRDAAELIANPYDVNIAALSYPYHGDSRPTGLGILWNLPAIQRGLRDTTPAVLLALEYLIQHPHVASDQIELVGVSLGAFLAAAPAALDTRICRLWLVHGGGDPQRVFERNLASYVTTPSLRRASAHFLAWVTDSHHISSEHWVGRLPPRPVIVINARHDLALPTESVMKLHNALREPYTVIWTEGGHILPQHTAIIDTLSQTVMQTIAEQPCAVPTQH